MVRAPRRRSVDDHRIAVVDAGRSTTRVAVFEGPRLLDRAEAAGGFPHPEAPGALEDVLHQLEVALAPLGHGPYDLLVLATTGVRQLGTTESRLQDALERRWGCEALVVNDVIAAYLGALGSRPGILLEAGTGSLVVGIADGRVPVVLDGWGHLAGDRGSGFALGRAGLRAAFAAIDGTGEATSLTPLLAGPDPERTIRALYASEEQTREVAALAPRVLRAAADGDRTALAAVEGVAAELVTLLLTAGRRLADPQLSALPVAGIGGLFEDALFRETVQRGLRAQLPHARLADAAGDALEGGRLLASTRHEPLTRLLTSAFRNEET
ncbi:MAG TPA: BadF/BadG/BcrA/BcrD ATPase family protein [Brachybacterium sp.]|nr:BadF/BadG/BcrA/BcrD ATPase family protein [Brachybacterium sp.]